jgi:16S rRNA (cytidine1402-2'-O)-methyltransferase
MNFQSKPLSAGLYFVSTPIGTARDITLRALDVLASADVIAAEDTRTARKLMDIHGIPLNGRPLVAYHDHSGDAVRNRLVAGIEKGGSVAYASEAGTPLVADPGYVLARSVIDAGLFVTSAPGPSAVLTALAVSGLPTDHFFFAGFLPNTKTARVSELARLRDIPGTLIFYESPKRVHGMLGDVADTYGNMRQCVLCRELTKKFEEVIRGTVGEVNAEIEERSLKGEIVVLIDQDRAEAVDDMDIEAALRDAMKNMRIKDAATAVAGSFGLQRRQVYQMALELGKRDE